MLRPRKGEPAFFPILLNLTELTMPLSATPALLTRVAEQADCEN